MGVSGLWKLFEPISTEESSLKQLALREGFLKNPRKNHTLVVGVDVSIWIYQSIAVFHNPNHTSSGQNPEICTLFYKLARLLGTCAVPVFMFDGPRRPSMKRGHLVRSFPHWVTGDLQDMIDVLGFYSHQAPGEADAELAYLNSVGAIDAVLTMDSDVFVFGARTVIRPSPNGRQIDRVMSYSLTPTNLHAKLQMSHEDIFLIAVLVGNDYDKGGLKGCGIALASRLAKSGFGHGLFAAVESSSNEEDIQPSLHAWHQQLQHELSADPSHALGQQWTQLANSVDDQFLPWQAMANFVQPITTQNSGGALCDPAAWILRLPDISKIARLCEQLFTWGTKAGIQAKLAEQVWPGACARWLLNPPDITATIEAWANDDVVFDTIPSMSDFLGIVGEKQGDREIPNTHLFLVRTNRHMLDAAVTSGIHGDCQQPLPESSTEQKGAHRQPDPYFKAVWVLAVLVKHALPMLAHSFDSRKKSHKVRLTPGFTKQAGLREHEHGPGGSSGSKRRKQSWQCREAGAIPCIDLTTVPFIDLTGDD